MTSPEKKARIVSHQVHQEKNDTSRAAVTFLIHSNCVAEARNYALSAELIEEGLQICKKIPMLQAGLNSQGTPFYCDKDGNRLDISFIDPDTAANTADHYYSVTHNYNGLH